MVRDFTQSEVQSLCELLGVSDLRDPDAAVVKSSLLIEDVRRVLKLPELPHSHLLDEQTWMMGGRVTRWLGGEMNTSVDDGDYDLFSGSFPAMERTLNRMLETGYSITRVQYMNPWPGIPVPRMLRRKPSPVRKPPRNASVPDLPGLLLRTMPDGRDMYCMRLTSPERHVIQFMYIPSLFPDGARPDTLIEQTDLSICQFTLDGAYLRAGPHSWSDFVRHRLRVVHMRSGRRTAGRLFKYAARGFWPDARTVQTVYGRWLSEALKRGGNPARFKA
ncbi:hypothetical protein [Corallococcus exiguus]|uniref:hypothetical protein n=1 Tax=Corallococcus exiguus TaxID=83462 RepID=UPI0014944A89|nr:hypothetical protein [Corallococcus exiguus]NPD23447.1 hypothetical protein [Corallococcus exiguus]